MKIIVSVLFALTIFYSNANAQSSDKSQTENSSKKIKVFVDCTREWLCDFSYIRQEIKMVDFVRDRFLADVHLLVNTQFTQGGAEVNQLNFIGQKTFTGKSDTLQYFNNATLTEDEKRKQLVKFTKLGLVGFIANSKIAEDLVITYNPKDTTAAGETAAQQKKDPWNFWQYRINASGFFNGNVNFKNENINAGVSATRETNTMRVNISLDYQKRKSVYQTSTGQIEANFTDITFNQSYLKKLTEHWGVGVGTSYYSSLFDNYDYRLRIRPRLEYSITPYKKFNSERFILQYLIGPEINKYNDTTIYFKTAETQVQQTLQAITSITKPWGSVNVGVFYSNYLSDFKKNNLEFSGSINWRIFKGFQMGVGGSYSIVKDQINIQKGTASAADVLTQRIALLSNYNYFMGVGFSYTFGSIYNNAVMPAFRGLNWGLNF